MASLTPLGNPSVLGYRSFFNYIGSVLVNSAMRAEADSTVYQVLRVNPNQSGRPFRAGCYDNVRIAVVVMRVDPNRPVMPFRAVYRY